MLYSVIVECLHTITFNLGTVFQSDWKNLRFSKNVTFIILGGSLQTCSLVNVLKVNNNSI